MDKGFGILGVIVSFLLIIGPIVESMHNTHMVDTTPDDRKFVLDGPDVHERIQEKCMDDDNINWTPEEKECAARIRD